MSLVYDNMPEYSSDTESRHLKIMLQNIRIVLVETSHTGNMGSVARAMKTMGLTNLWLVNPLVKPDSQAIALAAGASDVIGNAQIVDTLDEALAGCSLVVGDQRALPYAALADAGPARMRPEKYLRSGTGAGCAGVWS